MSVKPAPRLVAFSLASAMSLAAHPLLAQRRADVHVYGMALGQTSPIGRAIERAARAAPPQLDVKVLPNRYVLPESRIITRLFEDQQPAIVVVSTLGATTALVADNDAARAIRRLELPSCFTTNPLARVALVELAKLAGDAIAHALKPSAANFGGVLAAVDLGPVLLLSKKPVSIRSDLNGVTMGILDNDPVARDAFTSVGLGVAQADLSIVRRFVHRDMYQALYMPRAVLQEMQLDEPVTGTDYKAITQYLPHTYVANRALGLVIQNRAALAAEPAVRSALGKFAWSLAEDVSALFYAASAKSQPKSLPPAIAADVAKWDQQWSSGCALCKTSWLGLLKRVCPKP
ncbi:MAG: hypothetical protein KC492_40315 [Myxococcales bacterium]|nr:hypothetical protein [Myxococcales bacterium]